MSPGAALDSRGVICVDRDMLRPAAGSELEEAARLINTSYRGEAASQGWTHENDYVVGARISAGELEADLQSRPLASLLLHRDATGGELTGCVWIEPQGDGLWYLGLLAVRPDLQDRQLGRAILAEAEAMIRRDGGRIVRLTVVHVRESLIGWYQRRGYGLTGETQPFPAAGRVLRDLHLVVLEKRI